VTILLLTKTFVIDTFVFLAKICGPETLVFSKTHARCAHILFTAGDKWKKAERQMKKWKRFGRFALFKTQFFLPINRN